MNRKQGKNRKRQYIIWSFSVVLMVLIGVIIWQREWVYDFFRGMSYRPAEEMAIIRDSLNLTGEGKFLFNASQPELSDSGTFNTICRKDGDTEIAVLGCYTDKTIYIYDITEDELDGIRELTTAHELLHAKYARMSEAEKTSLSEVLQKVYLDNITVLEEDMKTYGESERQEELYVRAGTEIKNLPEILEKHYAKIFLDQDMVVGYYEKYIAVFRKVEAEMNALQTEMDAINSKIIANTEEYEKRIAQLEADIVSFNACAEVAGCFESENEFNERRGRLVAEQSALEMLYNEINELIGWYNEKVEKYNTDVVYSKKLNKAINSSKKPELVK